MPEPESAAARCPDCGQTAEDHIAALCRLRQPATAATTVVGCDRPGHPINYAHEHPYVSALCGDNVHEACTAVGQMMDAPGFCDCGCHRAVGAAR